MEEDLKKEYLDAKLISSQSVTKECTDISTRFEPNCPAMIQPTPFTLKEAFKELSFDSFPTFVFYLSNMLIWTFNLYYAGLRGDASLTSAVGLTNTWMGATTFYIILGLNIGTTALCSQAIGAGETRVAGIMFHRALIMRLLIALVLYPLQFFAYHIFMLFGVEDTVAQEAGLFCRFQLGVVLLIIIYDTLKSLLMANGTYTPFIFIQIAGIAVHWGVLWVFVVQFDMGILGFCAAMTCTHFALVILLIGYIIVRKPCPELLFFPKKDSYRELFKQLKEELPIGGILYLDFAAEQMSVMLSGVYPQEQLAAQILNYNVLSMMTLIPLGLNSTLTTYIGHAIGESDLIKLRRFIESGLIISLLLIIVEAPALYFFCDDVAMIFSDDTQVLAITRTLLKMYAIATIADFTQLVMSSILRGVGKEHIACFIFVIGNYVIGLPTGFVLGTLYEKYTVGMFTGIIVGMTFNAVATTIALVTVNLKRQSERISIKIEKKMRLGILASSFASAKSIQSLKNSRKTSKNSYENIEYNI